MQKLFERAREFVFRNARPVDFAIWRYHFEGGSSEDVLAALAAYQNPDGGFGHGLEADALDPNSSPIQTWAASMILRTIDCFDRNHPIVDGIVRYLTSGACFDGHCWSDTAPTSNDYPHAPWWEYRAPTAEEKRSYNPTASLAGFLLRTAETGSEAMLLGRRIAREAYDHLTTAAIPAEMHLLRCCFTLCSDVSAAAPELFDCDALFRLLQDAAAASVLRDADHWDSYCDRPSHYLAVCGTDAFPDLMTLAGRECDFIARTQLENGSWPVQWSWGAYHDEFAVSANFWRTQIITENLLFLRQMGRL